MNGTNGNGAFRRTVRVLAVAGLGVALVAGTVAVTGWLESLALADASSDQAASAQSTLAQDAYGALLDFEATPASLSEDELDDPVGAYVYDGQVVPVTARAVLEGTSGLAAALNDDGTYAAPTADAVLEQARNQVMAQLVADAGIEVSDDDIVSYIQSTFGIDTVAEVAQYYNLSEDEAWAVLRDSVGLVKLRDQVVGESPAVPSAPVAPDDGDTETPTAEYGAYVAELVGDAYDADTNTWTDPDGAYAQSLALTEFDGAAASYTTAQTAYYAAYYLYQQQTVEQLSAWRDYVNGYLDGCVFAAGTLRS
jgi:hypothetical protein